MPTCLVVTFNGNKVFQTADQVKKILAEPLSSVTSPEFLVLSLQEVAPLLEACFNKIGEYIHPYLSAVGPEYALVAKPNCGATALLVFRRKNVTIGPIWTKTAAFGTLWSSLKGAACVSIALDGPGERITFVGAHLHAGKGNKIPRDQDYSTLEQTFNLRELQGQIIVAGDLNYRTRNGSLAGDELTSERHLGMVAKGLVEHTVAFKPSYKYERNSLTFVKNRVPSWCDRVLFRKLEGTEILVYSSVYEPLASDHKPVYLSLKSGVSGPPIQDFLTAEHVQNELKGQLPLFSGYTKAADLLIGSGLYLTTTNKGRVTLGILLVIAAIYYLTNSGF